MEKLEQYTQRVTDKVSPAPSKVFLQYFQRVLFLFSLESPNLCGGSVHLRILAYGGRVQVGQLSL